MELSSRRSVALALRALASRALALLARRGLRPRLVVSGHIHGAHGVVRDGDITFVNAANAHKGHGDMGWPAVVVDI